MQRNKIFILFFLLMIPVDIKTSFAELVHNRFYYIKRLELVMPLLLKHTAKSPLLIQQAFLEFQKKLFFNSPIICQIVNDICASHDVQEVGALWEMFCHYRYVDDTLFLKEFIRIIALISLVLVVHDVSYDFISVKGLLSLYQETKELSLDSLVCCIHACSDYLCSKKGLDLQEKKYADVWDICNMIKKEEDAFLQSKSLLLNIDLIAERFYFVQRMDIAMHMLKMYADKGAFLSKEILKKGSLRKSEHALVAQVYDMIYVDKHIDSVFTLWELVKAYEYIEDQLLVQEFARLVLSLYKDLCMNCLNDDIKSLSCYNENTVVSLQKDPFLKDQKTVLEYIVTLYQIIDRLPLNEILDAIDVLARELPLLIQHAELSAVVSWKQWLKKYWWIPPFVIAALGFKFLKRLAYGRLSGLFSVHTPLISQAGQGLNLPSLVPDLAFSADLLVRPTGAQLLQ